MTSPRRLPIGRLAAIAIPLVLHLCSGTLTAGEDGPAKESPAGAEAAHPKLAVLVYFDQFRGDYLGRWQTQFGEGGFRRLTTDGAWFQNCHYPYSYTVTAAGHASVATGCSPERHAIVGNEWFERAEGQSVISVGAGNYQQVPLMKEAGSKKDGGISPNRLASPTLGDALKEATGGKGKVVALSSKDRAAVLPGGHHPDACYWFSAGARRFVTSTYYRNEPHPWVEDYERDHPAERWAGQQWTKLRSDLDYTSLSGPDDVEGEGLGSSQGRAFPHPYGGNADGSAQVNLSAVYNSPAHNELLLGLAKKAIEGEKLGQGDAPDLLTISFSSNDAVGHTWGPDSQEVLDITLRSDLLMKDLLTFLDEKVGPGRYILAMTADHGVCPLPEVSRTHGHPEAKRIPPAILNQKAEAFLSEKFGTDAKTRWFQATGGPWIYLDQELIKKHGLKSADVEAALAAWLKEQDGVQDAYTRTQLAGEIPADDAVGRSIRKSFHPDHSGDVVVIQEPYDLFGNPGATGTTHGTPHPYDTHVPLVIYGPGIHKGAREDRVTPQAAAAILAKALGIAPPKDAEAPVPGGLFE